MKLRPYFAKVKNLKNKKTAFLELRAVDLASAVENAQSLAAPALECDEVEVVVCGLVREPSRPRFPKKTIDQSPNPLVQSLDENQETEDK